MVQQNLPYDPTDPIMDLNLVLPFDFHIPTESYDVEQISLPSYILERPAFSFLEKKQDPSNELPSSDPW